MSRIEKAMEIAARMRNNAVDVQPEGETVASVADVSAASSVVKTRSSDVRAAFVPARPDKERLKAELPPIINPCLVMANAKDSPAAEQYRKLKSNLMKLVRKGECGLSLMITSPMAGEGKTVTSLNLAISLAHEFDHTVLLVEADLRKPSLLQYLGLQAEHGLSDCILEGMDVGQTLVKTGIGGLSVLPAGRPVDNPAELFSSHRMEALFGEIKSRYPDRFVIVDTTPVLPFAEPQYIANVVDGVVLVVREHLTSLDKFKRTLEMLKNHNLLGVVSNGVSRVASLDGYYGYYGYGYRYGGRKS